MLLVAVRVGWTWALSYQDTDVLDIILAEINFEKRSTSAKSESFSEVLMEAAQVQLEVRSDFRTPSITAYKVSWPSAEAGLDKAPDILCYVLIYYPQQL